MKVICKNPEGGTLRGEMDCHPPMKPPMSVINEIYMKTSCPMSVIYEI